MLPTEMAKLLPGAFSTFTLPVVLPNGSRSRVEGVPNIDWTHLFAHAVVVTQARFSASLPLLLLGILLLYFRYCCRGCCKCLSTYFLVAVVHFDLHDVLDSNDRHGESYLASLYPLYIMVSSRALLPSLPPTQELNRRYEALDLKMDVLKAETQNGG